MHYITYILLFI